MTSYFATGTALREFHRDLPNLEEFGYISRENEAPGPYRHFQIPKTGDTGG